MKKIFNLFVLMCVVLLTAVPFSSCSDNDGEEEVIGVTPADLISGVYSGRRMVGTTVVSDAYIVEIKKITGTTVSLKADFYVSDTNPEGIMNFNVTKQGEQYVLENATESMINIIISGNSISITYLTNGDYMMSYYGTKD